MMAVVSGLLCVRVRVCVCVSVCVVIMSTREQKGQGANISAKGLPNNYIFNDFICIIYILFAVYDI